MVAGATVSLVGVLSAPAAFAAKSTVTVTATSSKFFVPKSMITFLDMLNCILSTDCKIISNSITDNVGQMTFPSAGGAITGTAHYVESSHYSVTGSNSQKHKVTIDCPTTVTLVSRFSGTYDGHGLLSGKVTVDASGGISGYCGKYTGNGKPAPWHATVEGTSIIGKISDQGFSLPFTLTVTSTSAPTTTTTAKGHGSNLRGQLSDLLAHLLPTSGSSLLMAGTDCGTGATAPGPLCRAALAAGANAADFLAAQYGTAKSTLDRQAASLWAAVSFASSLKDKNGQSDTATLGAALIIADFVHLSESDTHHHTRPAPVSDDANLTKAELFCLIVDAIRPDEHTTAVTP